MLVRTGFLLARTDPGDRPDDAPQPIVRPGRGQAPARLAGLPSGAADPPAAAPAIDGDGVLLATPLAAMLDQVANGLRREFLLQGFKIDAAWRSPAHTYQLTR